MIPNRNVKNGDRHTLAQNKFHKRGVNSPSSQVHVIPAKAGIHFEMTIIGSFHQMEQSTKRKMDPRFRGDDMNVQWEW
jgi:hypothetical protein